MILYYLRLAHFHPTPAPPPISSSPSTENRITQQDMIDSYKTTGKIVYPLPMTGERRRREADWDEALRSVL